MNQYTGSWPVNEFKIDSNGKIDINLRENILLEASAGTGKTYSLERVVLNLIRDPKYKLQIKDILVVTFTNKATREMKERIRKILVESYRDEINPDIRLRLENAIGEFDEAAIYTIHSFCQNTLQTYPFESLSLFKQEINRDDNLLIKSIWDYIRSVEDENPLIIEGFSLLKGSGSFNNVVEKLVALYKREEYKSCSFFPSTEDIDYLKKLKQEFDNQTGCLFNILIKLRGYNSVLFHEASKAMKCSTRITSFQKLEAFLTETQNINFERFMELFYSKGFCENALKLTSDFLIRKSKKGLTPNDVDTTSREIIYDFDSLYAELDWIFDRENLTKNPLEKILVGEFINTSLKKIDKLFKSRQEKAGVLSYNDLIDNLHKRIMNENDSSLLDSLRKRYKVALIDEFQDTDKKQWDIFNRIFGNSSEHNFLLIGDPKQSIYGFRGADLEIYYKAKKSVSIDQRYVLGTNYRSEDGIINGCNVIFNYLFNVSPRGNTQRTEFEAVNVPDLNKKKKLKNTSQINQNTEFLVYDKELDSGKLLAVKDCKKGYFKTVVTKIADLIINEDNDPGDIAILVESHKDSQVLRDALQNIGVPVVISKQRNVYCSREAKHIHLLLTALNRPGSLGDIKALLLSPIFEYTLEEVHDLESNGGIEEFSSKLFSWIQLFNASGFIALWKVVESASNHGHLEKRLLNRVNGERSYTNYKHLIENLNSIHKTEKLNLLSLNRRFTEVILSSTEDEENSVRLDRESRAIQIMTIHASKGLEFPIVFFAGGLSKSSGSQGEYGVKYFDKSGKWFFDFLGRGESKVLNERDQWEEKKRLYYVALTRASLKLYMPLFPNGELMVLSSLYGSVKWDENRTMIEDRCGDKLLCCELPIHKQLKIDNSKLNKEIKSAYSKKIYEDVVEMANAHKELFYIDDSTYLDNSKFYYQLESKGTELLFTDIKNKKGFSNRVTWLSSYSGLTKDSHGSASKEDADRDDEKESDVVEFRTTGEINHFNIPGGAAFGDMVHEFFEEVDFNKYSLSLDEYLQDEEVHELYLYGAKKHFNLDWSRLYNDSVKTLTWNTLNSKLDLNGEFKRLGELGGENKIHEREFHFRIDKKESIELYNLNLEFDKGYLKGFIDLIINFNGVLYIADWKTTTIRGHEEFDNYCGERVEKSMDEHNYHLQGLIYTVALYLHLKLTKKDFNYNRDIGGYFYFYVRGMGPNTNTGVSFRKPEEVEILNFLKGIRDD